MGHQVPDIVYRAISLASQAHRGQFYGEAPYKAHLLDVVTNLHYHGVGTPILEAAAWLHDSVEDTEVTVEDVRDACGDEVAELVFAVTNEEGGSREERFARTYPKILAVPGAIDLKLADRIANVEACWKGRDRKLFMYQKEYETFRKALFTDLPEGHPGGSFSMWCRLDRLLGWKDSYKG